MITQGVLIGSAGPAG